MSDFQGEPWEELVPAESSAEFWSVFTNKVQAVRSEIVSLPSTTSEAVEELKKLKKCALDLQRYAEQSSSELVPYDVKRSQETYDTLLKDIKALEEKHAPKKKFAFSKAAKASVQTAATAPSASSSSGSGVAPSTPTIAAAKAAIPLPPGSHVIADNVDQTIALPHSPARDLDVACQLLIRRNTNTTIHLPWYCGSVRLEENRDCRIVLGPCATSVYLEGLHNCTVFIASHQLRIHNSHGCRLYVRCASHPIIEDCSDMGFAPYSLRYAAVDADADQAGLTQAKCWDNVVDFRWHKTEASPNWFVIPESERLLMDL